MKNLNLIFTAILFALFALTSCEKEGLEEIDTITNETTESLISDEDSGTEFRIEVEKTQAEQANSRSATRLIYSRTITSDRGEWDRFYMLSEELPNPELYKYEVYITPLSGNPDLFVFGWNEDADDRWRNVRESKQAGLAKEFVSFRKTDLKNNEERLYFPVKSRTNTRYRIEIYETTVDCFEFSPAETVVYSQVVVPICTCDGNNLNHPAEASNLGYTSWTNGPCKIKDGIYENWLLGNPNADFFIKKIQVSRDGQYVQVQSTACSSGINSSCTWDRERLVRFGTSSYKATFREGNLTATLIITREADLVQLEVTLIYANGGGAFAQQETLMQN